MNNFENILNSAQRLDRSENKKFKRKSGRRSKYDQFVDIASDLERGEGLYFDTPVNETVISGVRNRVYKKLGKDEWNVNSEKVKESSDGTPFFTLHIEHLDN